MTSTLERARAYVDGELSAADASALEKECLADPQLAAEVAALEVSRLPYRAAAATAQCPPLPKYVSQSVATAIANARLEETQRDSQSLAGRARRLSKLAIAASFAAGLVIGPLALGYLNKNTPDARTEWAELVAAYQSLYVPETISGIDPKEARQRAEQLLASISASSGLPKHIPDLQAEGYRFVRAQQLGYQGQPLVQLVYASKEGEPLAVCYMPDSVAGETEAVIEHLAGLDTIHWRDGGNRYVIVAEATAERLLALQALSMQSTS